MTGVVPPSTYKNPPRLTVRGAGVLVAIYLLLGPVLSFGIGMPLNMLGAYVAGSTSDGTGNHGQGIDAGYFWANLLMSPVLMVIGLPIYGYWADLHLWFIGAWAACWMVLIASSSRGLRIGDAALMSAVIVLSYPFLVDADSPHITWAYPDAFFMAGAAAIGAALCTVLVRGIGAAGIERRLGWGWLTEPSIRPDN